MPTLPRANLVGLETEASKDCRKKNENQICLTNPDFNDSYSVLGDWVIHFPPVKQCNNEPLRARKTCASVIDTQIFDSTCRD